MIVSDLPITNQMSNEEIIKQEKELRKHRIEMRILQLKELMKKMESRLIQLEIEINEGDNE